MCVMTVFGWPCPCFAHTDSAAMTMQHLCGLLHSLCARVRRRGHLHCISGAYYHCPFQLFARIQRMLFSRSRKLRLLSPITAAHDGARATHARRRLRSPWPGPFHRGSHAFPRYCGGAVDPQGRSHGPVWCRGRIHHHPDFPGHARRCEHACFAPVVAHVSRHVVVDISVGQASAIFKSENATRAR